ncbi:MAG: T9SS type A sorting domain-containing protein [Flavobacteriales bacterium]
MRTTFLLLACALRLLSIAQPANDNCFSGQLLLVHALGDCPVLSIAGNNAAATGIDAPSCDVTSTFFKDVWYYFNSGPNTEVFVDFTFVTIDEWGIEVLDACGGNSIFCDSTAGFYTVPVLPSTDYRLRVFSNADFASGGVFTICLSGSGVIPLCDGATVLSNFGTADLDLCKDGAPDIVDFGSTTTASESYAFLLTDAGDVLISVIAPPVDFDTVPIGNYRVYGISFEGALVNALPDTALSQVSSSGQCFDLTDNFMAIMVDICSGVPGEGAGPTWIVFPNPNSGDFRVHCSQRIDGAELRLFDLAGRLVHDVRPENSGPDGSEVHLGGSISPGTYVLNVHAGSWERSIPLVVQ